MAKGKYQEWLKQENLEAIKGWKRSGLSDEQVAKDKMGISPSTLYEWAKKYTEISEAISCGRECADARVVNALFVRAMGYTIPVRKCFKVRTIEYDDNGRKIRESEEIKTAEEDMHVPAEFRAQEFWLRNHKPEEWKKDPIIVQNETRNTGGVILLADIDEEARTSE